MSDELKLVVEAIDSLRQEPSYFKDYMFPIVSAFFTSILGAGIAYFTVRHQEGIQIEKDKMNVSNRWTLKAEEARAELIAIKGNYHGSLTEVPFQRVAAVPTILFHAKPIEESYQDLSFILPDIKRKEQVENKWSQIPRIRTMISNYNYLLELWNQRNFLNEEIKKIILQHAGDKAFSMWSLEDLIAVSGEVRLVKLLDLNERVIGLTDDLIVELDDFLIGFPTYVKNKIKIKKLKRYGSILSYSNNGNELLENIIRRSPVANYATIESLFGESSQDIKNRHHTGYEK